MPVTFTASTLTPSAWNQSAFGGDIVCQIDDAGNSAASVDGGKTWAYGTIPGTVTLFYGLKYVGGWFVACQNANGSVDVIRSTDGITWLRVVGALPNLGGFWDVRASCVKGNTIYVASQGPNVVARSSDGGATWATQLITPSVGGDVCSKMAASDTLICLVTNYGYVQTSTDGITWVQRGAIVLYNVNGITASAGVFYALVGNGDIYTSSDCITWVLDTTTRLFTTPGAMGINAGKYLGLGTGNIFTTSADGVAWTFGDLPFYGSASGSCTLGSSLLVGFTVRGDTTLYAVITNDGGATWTLASTGLSTTIQTPELASTNSFAALFQYNSNIVRVTSDGTTWTSHTLPVSAAWQNKPACSPTRMVQVAVGGQTVTSTDGVTWVSGSSLGAGTWRSPIWTGSLFATFNTSYGAQTYQTSTDGLTWVPRTLPGSLAAGYSLCGHSLAGKLVLFDPYYSPTMYYDAADGVNFTAHTWPGITPSYTPILSGTLYTTRSAGGPVSSTDGLTFVDSVVPSMNAQNMGIVAYQGDSLMLAAPDGGSSGYLKASTVMARVNGRWDVFKMPRMEQWEIGVAGAPRLSIMASGYNGSNFYQSAFAYSNSVVPLFWAAKSNCQES